MKPGEVYQWNSRWHETFLHLLVGSSEPETSFIQTIWIDKEAISSDNLLPAVPPITSHANPSNQSNSVSGAGGSGGSGASVGGSGRQGSSGVRAEQFMYHTDYMIFMRSIDIQKNGFDSHGYNEPFPSMSDDDLVEEEESDETVVHSTYQLQDFVTYFWFEFLLFSPDGERCNLCTWIFLEQNDNGIPLKPEKVFYKYFEETFPSTDENT